MLDCPYCTRTFELGRQLIEHKYDAHPGKAVREATFCHNCGMDWAKAIEWDREQVSFCPTCGRVLRECPDQ